MDNAGVTRKRDAARTRQAILRAAQNIFSTRSYGDASIKDITALAGVNPALVSRYFGSKEKMYEAALGDMLDTGKLTSVTRGNFGELVAERFTSETEEDINPLPMLVFAASDERIRKIAVRLLAEKTLGPLQDHIGGKNAELRAAQIMAISTGFFTYRLVLPLAPFQGQVSPHVRDWLAKSLQMIMDAD